MRARTATCPRTPSTTRRASARASSRRASATSSRSSPTRRRSTRGCSMPRGAACSAPRWTSRRTAAKRPPGRSSARTRPTSRPARSPTARRSAAPSSARSPARRWTCKPPAASSATISSTCATNEVSLLSFVYRTRRLRDVRRVAPCHPGHGERRSRRARRQADRRRTAGGQRSVLGLHAPALRLLHLPRHVRAGRARARGAQPAHAREHPQAAGRHDPGRGQRRRRGELGPAGLCERHSLLELSLPGLRRHQAVARDLRFRRPGALVLLGMGSEGLFEEGRQRPLSLALQELGDPTADDWPVGWLVEAGESGLRALGADANGALTDERLVVSSRELGMAFDAEHGFADTEHGDLAMLTLPEDHAVRGQTPDLVLVHVLEPAARLRRLHPGFLPQNRHVENANAPSLSGAPHLSAQGLGQRLVAEADTDERLARLVQPLQEAG